MKYVTNIRVSAEGILQYSLDGGCTWADLVQVPGSNGVTPHIDPVTKHWMVGDEDTGIIAEGVDGTDGTSGTNGITPTVEIDSNGFWVINGVRQEYKAAGNTYEVVAAAASTIGVPGTPSVEQTLDYANSRVILTFDHLKGEKPAITTEATTNVQTGQTGYIIKADDTPICTVYNGIDGQSGSEYTGINPVVVDNSNHTIYLNGSTHIPTGSIEMYAGSTAPTGWFKCTGDYIELIKEAGSQYYTVPKAQTIQGVSFPQGALQELVDILVSTYGKAYAYQRLSDGKWWNGASWISDTITYFNSQQTVADTVEHYYIQLPDLQQRFPLGFLEDESIGKDNENSGNGWSTSLGKKGGEDTHTLVASESGLPSHAHSLHYTVDGNNGDLLRAYSSTGTSAELRTTSTETASGSDAQQAHNNMPPFLALNFIIKY